jgi:hypothetical protein
VEVAARKKPMSNDAEHDRLRRSENIFVVAFIVLLVITAMAWGWKDFLIVLFLGGTIEWFITDAKRKVEIKSLHDTTHWLKRRLDVVDPHWEEDFLHMTADEPRLHPPPEEIVATCPKCNRAIRRRELARRYNGGWSAS